MSGIINTKGNLAKILFRTVLWHAKYLATGRGFPLIATFQLTNRCNLRCIMCNIPNNPAQMDLPLEDFRGIIDGLANSGCCFASLSGGEVLTMGNFFDYAAAAKKRLPSVNMVTNGLLLDKAGAMEIRKSRLDSVSVSLDGMKATHEKTRGRKGAFDRTVNAIELVKTHAPGVRVVVNTVIAPWNMGELKELVRFVESLGAAHKFQPLNVHPTFDGQRAEYNMDDKRGFDRGEVEDLVGFLIRQKNVANSAYFLKSIPWYLAGREGGGGAGGEGDRGRKHAGGLFDDNCMLPVYYCEFREDGRMYPCLGGTNWMGGHPVTEGVEKVFSSERYREDIRRLKSCRTCTRSYSVCYIEPRVVFPINNFLKYKLLYRFKNASKRKAGQRWAPGRP